MQHPTSYQAMPTLSTVLQAWFFKGSVQSYVEACEGFACATQCPMSVDVDGVTGTTGNGR